MPFSPYDRSDQHPCWYCVHFGGLVPAGPAKCSKDGLLNARPALGCAFFEREVGVDDDAWKPVVSEARSGR